MKILQFFIFLLVVISAQACDKQKDTTPIDEPRITPFQKGFVRFSLDNLGITFDEEEDLCQTANVYQELSYGGNSGFEHISGSRYTVYGLNSHLLQAVTVRFRIRGFDEAFSSRIEASELYRICNDYPEQCFGNIVVEYDRKQFVAMEFQAVPFYKKSIDPSAEYSYTLLAEPYRMECFENRIIIPVLFEFDGYVYTQNRQDSLKISDFKSQVWVMESF
jgi:hypothetical protein